MTDREPRDSSNVDELIRRARTAQPAWAATPLSARVRMLRAAKTRLLSLADEIGAVVAEETGKPLEEALLAEVIPNADVIDHWCAEVDELLEPEEVVLDAVTYPGKTGHIHREARGVVALITPWNFPVALPLRSIVPALLAGNTIVFKPSEVTPRSGELIVNAFKGILPEGVLVLAQGDGSVGASIVAGDVDLVIFTGSVATGRKIAVACAERLIPCSLELGGKDAAIVLADARLERAANGVVWGAFNNAGQNCGSIERVYVERPIADAFIKRVVELTKELRPGKDVGKLTTARQCEIVREHVERAVADGAEVLAGGPSADPRDGTGYPVTVLKLVDEATPLMRDETFGPVLPIVVVDTADEAVRRANDSRYGLTASIWTTSLRRGETLARQLRAGVVTVNNHAFTGAIPAAPWGGVGESGYGVTNSSHAFHEMTRPRFVLVDSSRGARELWWYPYNDTLRAIARAMPILLGGGGIGARIKALFTLIGAFPKRLLGR